VHLHITRGKSGQDLTPIFWSDNYFSLLPGEQKEVTAAYDPADLEGNSAILVMDGYNVAAQTSEIN
jgi:Exo-beta-D-glucosaminidase Ig-fold domain